MRRSLQAVGLPYRLLVLAFEVLLLFLFLFGYEDRIVRQKIVLDALKRLQVALRYPRDGIAVVKVQETDAESFPDVLKHLNRIWWRCLFSNLSLLAYAVSVVLGVDICNGRLILDLPRVLVQFWRQVVDPPAARIVALKGVAVCQTRELHDGNSPAPFTRQAIFLVLHIHHLVCEGALVEVEVQAVH